MTYSSYLDGTTKITDGCPITTGDTIQVTQGEHTGYYRVLAIDRVDDKPIYRLLPERGWAIVDPVEQRHHVIGLTIPEWCARIVDEHAPACRTCGELWPCTHARDMCRLDRNLEDMEQAERKRHQTKEARRQYRARYSMPGVCPACKQPVTLGQPSQTFDTNAVLKDGPPITYHVSRRCGIDTPHHSMHDYQKRLNKKARQ